MQFDIEKTSAAPKYTATRKSNTPTILATLYVVLASVYTFAMLFGNLAYYSEYFTMLLSTMTPVASIGICMLLARSPRPLIPFCIITGAVMFISPDLALSSVLCVFVSLTCVYAFLLKERYWWLAAMASAVSFAILFLWQGTACSLISLSYIPVGVTLFGVFKLKKQRVPSVASLSICMGLILVALLAMSIYSSTGSLSADTVKEFFASFRAELLAQTTDAINVALEELPLEINTDALFELMDLAITLTLNLLPAIVAICLFVISFVAHSLYISIISRTVEDKSEITNAITFNMSVISAVIFLVAYVASIILSFNGEELYSVVAQNIYTMLFPGFTVITLGFVTSVLRSRPASFFKVMLYVGIFGMLFFMTGAALLLASIAGAILVIIFAIKSKLDNQ